MLGVGADVEAEVASNAAAAPIDTDVDDFESLLQIQSIPEPDTAAAHSDIVHELTQETKLNDYIHDFDGTVPAAEVLVQKIPLELVQQRELELEQARIAKAAAEAKEFQARETFLAHKEKLAKQRLNEATLEQRRKLAEKELQSLQLVQLQSQQLMHVYHQAETHMKHVLGQQQAFVQDTFGKTTTSVPAHTRRYRSEWKEIPQPIEIRMHMLRAVKDKLPHGHYVILATLYDRLGGAPVSWTVAGDRGINSEFPGLTTPILHRGHFYNTELVVDQNVFLVCPPQSELRPANVIVFEVYLLSGQQAVKDAVVAWGVLPVCNADFDVVAGQFKVPFLRGDIDHTIAKFQDMEHMYSTDLSSWLCNMYVTVRHLPRERLDAKGILQREYDVELDFMNQLLKLESCDRELLARQEYSDIPSSQSISSRFIAAKPVRVSNNVAWGKEAASLRSKMATRRRKKTKKTTILPFGDDEQCEDDEIKITDEKDDENEKKKMQPNATPQKRIWRNWFRKRWRPRTPSHRQLIRQHSDMTALLDTHLAESVNDINNADELVAAPTDAPLPAHAQRWEGFTFSTNHYIGDVVAKHNRFQTARKMRYLRQELFADMGFNKIHTLQCWLMIIFLLLALWLRLYVHYLGQWLYLRASNVPVFDFRPQLLTCVLKYTWNTIPTGTEIGVISLGIVFNLITFAGLMAIAWACQRCIGEFPDIASRFIACYGLGVVFDPILILLVDLWQHNFNCASLSECRDPSATLCNCAEGDAFKLYQRFNSEEGTGVVGVVLTLLIYAALMTLAAGIFYTYLLHFHMNGRMLDVYRRIHAREGVFFVPNDFEVSGADVSLLCEKAARWKSIQGTQRKTAVCEYELRDPLDPSYVETTVHIAIFNLELDGSRQLYRHFIKNPDGEILEVFGTISDSLGSQYATLETALFQTAPPDEVHHTGLFDAI